MRAITRSLAREYARRIKPCFAPGLPPGASGVFGEVRTADVLAVTWMNLQVLSQEDWKELTKAFAKDMRPLNKVLRDEIKKVRKANGMSSAEQAMTDVTESEISEPGYYE